jgi:hypothetical protein
MDSALEEVRLSESSRRPLSDEAILAVRDAAMLATCIGHVGLTVRISAVRTVKAPCFSEEPCQVPGCTTKGCKGNRLVAVEPDEGAEVVDLVEDNLFKLDIPHHKNSGRGQSMPQVPITSPKLSQLLVAWVDKGRPAIVQYLKSINPEYLDPQNLFLTKQGLDFKELSRWYRGLHIKYKAPYPLITLQAYRSVFVSDRLEDPDRPGPEHAGAATIMGNSLPQWEASYYKNKRIKQAQRAAKSMGAYRRSHLKEAGYLESEGEELEEDGQLGGAGEDEEMW